MGIPEGEELEKGPGRIFKEVMASHFPILILKQDKEKDKKKESTHPTRLTRFRDKHKEVNNKTHCNQTIQSQR